MRCRLSLHACKPEGEPTWADSPSAWMLTGLVSANWAIHALDSSEGETKKEERRLENQPPLFFVVASEIRP